MASAVHQSISIPVIRNGAARKTPKAGLSVLERTGDRHLFSQMGMVGIGVFRQFLGCGRSTHPWRALRRSEELELPRWLDEVLLR